MTDKENSSCLASETSVTTLLSRAVKKLREFEGEYPTLDLEVSNLADELEAALNAESQNPEQRHSGGVAESQAPSIRDGDAGVAPGHPPVVPESRLASAVEGHTPRTDARAVKGYVMQGSGWMFTDKREWVFADDARQLERELAEAQRKLDVSESLRHALSAPARSSMQSHFDVLASILQYFHANGMLEDKRRLDATITAFSEALECVPSSASVKCADCEERKYLLAVQAQLRDRAEKAESSLASATAVPTPPMNALAEGFGDPETLLNSRDWLEKAITAKGAKTYGAGIGCGQADISFTLDGCRFNVSLRPIMPDSDSARPDKSPKET